MYPVIAPPPAISLLQSLATLPPPDNPSGKHNGGGMLSAGGGSNVGLDGPMRIGYTTTSSLKPAPQIISGLILVIT